MAGRKSVNQAERDAVEKAGRYLAGGSNGNTVFQDVLVRRGKGSRVWDMSGNEYVDYLLGSGPMLVGHAHPDVVSAVTEQVGQGSTFFAPSDLTVALAEEIVHAVPCAESVRFSSTGTEATNLAMRVARAYRGRDKVLKFEGGFHGMNDYGLMSLVPQDPPDFPKPSPSSAGIPAAAEDTMLIAPFNDLETAKALITQHHDDLGAVIVEPMQRAIAPVPGFLEGLREITFEYHVPLIFDEIVTGFRFSYGGGQEYYGVTPDLCSLGKAVGGGFPLSAVAGKAEIMAHFDADAVAPQDFVPQIGTLNGNPVACAAGLATLEVLRREGTYQRLFSTGLQLKESMQQILDRAEMPAQIVGVGPMFDIHFTADEIVDYRSTLAADASKVDRLSELLLERGVYKGETKFYVSTVHDQDDVQQTLDAFESAVGEL